MPKLTHYLNTSQIAALSKIWINLMMIWLIKCIQKKQKHLIYESSIIITKGISTRITIYKANQRHIYIPRNTSRRTIGSSRTKIFPENKRAARDKCGTFSKLLLNVFVIIAWLCALSSLECIPDKEAQHSH